MHVVKITEFRKHLPAYLKRVEKGDEIQLTNRGKVVARIVPEKDERSKARKRLESLRGKMIVGDVMSPIENVEWSGDADNL